MVERDFGFIEGYGGRPIAYQPLFGDGGSAS